MSGAARRGGIPGPESRTGLVRPAMTEAEFERRQREAAAAGQAPGEHRRARTGRHLRTRARAESSARPRRRRRPRSRASRAKAVKPKRVQRMFALEEELDKKLWLYAIHVGKDRSEVVNDLLRPLVASMVLYDSRDRRGVGIPRVVESEGESAA